VVKVLNKLKKRIWMIGAGDFSFDIASRLINSLSEDEVFGGFIDDRATVVQKTREQCQARNLTFDFFHPDQIDFSSPNHRYLFGVGDPKYKQAFSQRHDLNEAQFQRFFDSARINEHASLGPSIYWYCSLASNIEVGHASFIDALTVVGHGVRIGNFCHIAVNVILGGNAVIEDACYLHSGAIIGNEVRIGEGSVVGAGAIVLRDLPSHSVVVAPKSVKISG